MAINKLTTPTSGEATKADNPTTLVAKVATHFPQRTEGSIAARLYGEHLLPDASICD